MKYTIVAKGTTIDLVLCDEIWHGGEASAQYVREALAAAPEATLIRVRINSVGGDVDEGLDIYRSLVDHPARVEGYVTGLAASIASVILCACDHVKIAEGAQVMVHNPWTQVAGNAKDLRQVADTLEQSTQGLIAIYKARTGKTEEELVDLLGKETYFDCEAAIAAGFADEIVKAKPSSKEIASLAIKSLSRAPEKLVRLVARAKGSVMDPQLLAALGLAADAPLEDVLAAIVALKGAKAADPPIPPKPAEEEEDPVARAVADLPPAKQAQILALVTRSSGGSKDLEARMAKLEKDTEDRELATLYPLIPAHLQKWARKQSASVLREYVSGAGLTPTVTEISARTTVTASEDEEAIRAVAKATGLPQAKIREDLAKSRKGDK